MKKHTCSFVKASDLFKGLSTLWDICADSNPPFTWGDNNRSLVTAVTILDHLDLIGLEAGKEEKQLETLRKRVEKIGLDTYVDLEN